MRMHEEEHYSRARRIPPLSGNDLACRAYLGAPSKNICHTSSSEVILAQMTSSGISVCSLDVFKTGWAARKSARVYPLTAYYETKVMQYWDSRMAQLASLEFKDPGFVMRMRRRLTLETTCIVWPTKKYHVFWTAKTRARHSFSTGLYRDSAPNRVLLRQQMACS